MAALPSRNMQLKWICYNKICALTDYVLVMPYYTNITGKSHLMGNIFLRRLVSQQPFDGCRSSFMVQLQYAASPHSTTERERRYRQLCLHFPISSIFQSSVKATSPPTEDNFSPYLKEYSSFTTERKCSSQKHNYLKNIQVIFRHAILYHSRFLTKTIFFVN